VRSGFFYVHHRSAYFFEAAEVSSISSLVGHQSIFKMVLNLNMLKIRNTLPYIFKQRTRLVLLIVKKNLEGKS